MFDCMCFALVYTRVSCVPRLDMLLEASDCVVYVWTCDLCLEESFMYFWTLGAGGGPVL